MRIINQCAVTMAIVVSLTTAASAERLWKGHIHLVDYRLKLDFADYGSSDMQALRHIEIKTGRAGKFHQAGFAFVPDDDDPFRAWDAPWLPATQDQAGFSTGLTIWVNSCSCSNVFQNCGETPQFWGQLSVSKILEDCWTPERWYAIDFCMAATFRFRQHPPRSPIGLARTTL